MFEGIKGAFIRGTIDDKTKDTTEQTSSEPKKKTPQELLKKRQEDFEACRSVLREVASKAQEIYKRYINDEKVKTKTFTYTINSGDSSMVASVTTMPIEGVVKIVIRGSEGGVESSVSIGEDRLRLDDFDGWLKLDAGELVSIEDAKNVKGLLEKIASYLDQGTLDTPDVSPLIGRKAIRLTA